MGTLLAFRGAVALADRQPYGLTDGLVDVHGGRGRALAGRGAAREAQCGERAARPE